MVSTSGLVKTGSQCNAEYAANKAAIKNETIPQGAATAPPAAVPPQSVPMATADGPSPRACSGNICSRLRARARQLWRRSHTRWRRRVHVRAASAAIAARAMRFVWVNTKSRVYDFEGPENYRHTTRRAYMCETDAMAAGARAAMNEKHP